MEVARRNSCGWAQSRRYVCLTVTVVSKAHDEVVGATNEASVGQAQPQSCCVDSWWGSCLPSEVATPTGNQLVDAQCAHVVSPNSDRSGTETRRHKRLEKCVIAKALYGAPLQQRAGECHTQVDSAHALSFGAHRKQRNACIRCAHSEMGTGEYE